MRRLTNGGESSPAHHFPASNAPLQARFTAARGAR